MTWQETNIENKSFENMTVNSRIHFTGAKRDVSRMYGEKVHLAELDIYLPPDVWKQAVAEAGDTNLVIGILRPSSEEQKK